MNYGDRVCVIAKISGRYRILCGIDFYHEGENHWIKAVKDCLLFKNIYEASANRIPIQAELLSAKDQPEEFWDMAKYPPPYAPAYIATCLNIGACMDRSNFAITLL